MRGTVRSVSGTSIRGAMVGIAGSTLYTQTDADGRYRLAAVPAGEIRLRAAAIGYSPAATVVTLAGGDSTTVDFTLEPSPLELTPVDVVSTKLPQFGDHPATSVAQVSPEEISRRAVNTIDEAVDKEPGIQFLNGQINIRGSTGYVQGLNSRVLLTVDGVPMNQGDRGGINWDLLSVDDVASVEILKGAGSSLYGSAAFGGVVNLITGSGGKVGTPLMSHPEVKLVSFTGSTRAGISVAKNAADTVKRVAQELGGKSPNIILEGTPLDKALPGGAGGVLLNSGQSCVAPTRMLVHRSQYDEAVRMLEVLVIEYLEPGARDAAGGGFSANGVRSNRLPQTPSHTSHESRSETQASIWRSVTAAGSSTSDARMRASLTPVRQSSSASAGTTCSPTRVRPFPSTTV